jgi:competence protein ComEC
MAILAMVFIIAATVGWNNKWAVLIGITGIVLILGSFRFKQDFAQNDIARFYGQKVQVQGVIIDEPDVRSDKIYLTLGKLVINQKPIKSKLLVSVAPSPRYDYGQKLSFETKILEPKEYPDFSYKNYLSRFGIDGVAYQPQISFVPGKFGNPVKAVILNIKKKFVNTLDQILPQPQSSFLTGLLLGAKHSIPQSLTDQFNRTGTSHIVAISGYNITIIAAAVAWLLQWLGIRKRVSFWFSVLAIILFVLMTGASASAVRAGIMGGLLLLALNTGRLSNAANALAFTAAAMLLFNPQILAFDVGFQLSFGALLGIIYLSPILEPYFLWLPQFLRQYFLATLTAQIFVLPILLYNFGQLSIVALLPNILVLPLVPIAMLFGFLTGFLGLIWLKLSIPVSGITWLVLTYIIKIIGLFASLPFAAISWHISFWMLVVYYLIILLMLLIYYWRQSLQNADFALNLQHIKQPYELR